MVKEREKRREREYIYPKWSERERVRDRWRRDWVQSRGLVNCSHRAAEGVVFGLILLPALPLTEERERERECVCKGERKNRKERESMERKCF